MAKKKKFRKTMAIKLALLIELLLIVAISVTTTINVTREIRSIQNDVSVRMGFVTNLIQRAYDKLSPEDFDEWVNDIYSVTHSSNEYSSEIIYILVLTGREEVL